MFLVPGCFAISVVALHSFFILIFFLELSSALLCFMYSLMYFLV